MAETSKIAIFYHVLLALGGRVLPQAGCIVSNQIVQMVNSGLWGEAQEIHIGMNGADESIAPAKHIIPEKAKITYHGLDSRAENLTIVMLWEWAKLHPGWRVLYLHSKSASHPGDSDYAVRVAGPWREGMMKYLVTGWRQCVEDLNSHDIACAHWMWNLADGTQHIPCGNFLWVTSDFVASLPSMYERDRIKQSGIAALESRYEAEVFWGNGRRPTVKQYLPNGGGGVP